MIYVDNPVGTGYSFTNGGYAQNETAVGEDLYNALQQFFKLFPELRRNEFYVAGESYCGKFVPAISYAIHVKNPSANLKINLQGMAIGSGYSDPEHQSIYGDHLYELGLIDSNTRALFKKYEEEGLKYIQNKQWLEALKVFTDLVGDGNTVSLFKNATGFNNLFNYLKSNDTDEVWDLMIKYVQRDDIRAHLHVGNTTFNGYSAEVDTNLMLDILQSVAPWVSELLSHYRVLTYNGQLDLSVAYPATENYLQHLKFSGADEYKTAERHQWWSDGKVAGYVKQAGNLTEVLVRNAGHIVPQDQPQWMFELFTKFTHRKPYY